MHVMYSGTCHRGHPRPTNIWPYWRGGRNKRANLVIIEEISGLPTADRNVKATTSFRWRHVPLYMNSLSMWLWITIFSASNILKGLLQTNYYWQCKFCLVHEFIGFKQVPYWGIKFNPTVMQHACQSRWSLFNKFTLSHTVALITLSRDTNTQS